MSYRVRGEEPSHYFQQPPESLPNCKGNVISPQNELLVCAANIAQMIGTRKDIPGIFAPAGMAAGGHPASRVLPPALCAGLRAFVPLRQKIAVATRLRAECRIFAAGAVVVRLVPRGCFYSLIYIVLWQR